MELKTELPKNYYSFAKTDLETLPKDNKERMAITLSLYISCKLEKYCYKNGEITYQELFKTLLVNKGVLTAEEINLKHTHKSKFDFIDKDGKFKCKNFEGAKANKQFLIYLSSYAKVKIIQFLLKEEKSLTWFLKSELVKKDILKIEDLAK